MSPEQGHCKNRCVFTCKAACTHLAPSPLSMQTARTTQEHGPSTAQLLGSLQLPRLREEADCAARALHVGGAVYCGMFSVLTQPHLGYCGAQSLPLCLKTFSMLSSDVSKPTFSLEHILNIFCPKRKFPNGLTGALSTATRGTCGPAEAEEKEEQNRHQTTL